MEVKGIIASFKKRVNWMSNKNFLSYCRNLIDQGPDLLNHGLGITCSSKMKEVIELCEQRKRRQDKDFWWVYAMACCLHEQTFYRFGKKTEGHYLERANKIAQENDFTDIIFWINKCKLDYSAICGRTHHVQEARALVFSCLERMKGPSSYEILILPVLAWDALNHGDFESAQQWASEVLELVNKLEYINLKIQGNILLGKVAFELKAIEESLLYLEKAISLGREKRLEQLIPALYSKGEVFLEQGKIIEAKKYLDEAQQKLETELELPDSYYHIHLARLHGLLTQKERRFERAEECFSQAIKIAQKEENPLEEGKTQLELGKLYAELADYEKATIALEEASAKFIITDNQFQLSRVKETQDNLRERRKRSITPELIQEPSSRSRQKIEMLDEFMKVVVSNLDLDAVLNNVIEHIMKVTNADRVFLALLDEAGKLYSHVIRTKEKFDQKKSAIFKDFSRTITEKVLDTQKSIWLTDAQADSHFAIAESISALDIRSVICVPLKKEKKEIIGLIYIDKQSFVNAFTSDDLALVESMAEYASIALVNARLHSGVQRKLQATESQLIQSEKLATVGTLAGGVAHEINNPLTAILTNVQMLLAENKIDDKLDRESLELIEEATKRCRTIVQKLMTYAKKPLEPTKVSEIHLLKATKNVISFLGYQLEQENIKIIIEAKEDGYLVMGNQNELEQVLTNIILNARDAINKIKKSGNIYITLSESSDWIKLEIKDEGAGMPKEIMPKIFDPFFTTKEVGKGVGLGLSICQSIIEKHNGLITVQSEPNKGSVFTVQLPKAKIRNVAHLTT